MVIVNITSEKLRLFFEKYQSLMEEFVLILVLGEEHDSDNADTVFDLAREYNLLMDEIGYYLIYGVLSLIPPEPFDSAEAYLGFLKENEDGIDDVLEEVSNDLLAEGLSVIEEISVDSIQDILVYNSGCILIKL